MLTRAIRKFRYWIGLCLLAAVSTSAWSAAPESSEIILGVQPYLNSTELKSRFRGLQHFLADVLGQPVKLRIARDYQEHLEMTGSDQIDISFLGPAAYVQMTEKYGAKRLLSRLEINGRGDFQGVIVARLDSRVFALEDLVNRRFAFGDPHSAMGHLVPRDLLLQNGIPVEKLAGYEFLNSNENVALGVLMGDFDAGAVKSEVFRAYQSRGLVPLARTQRIAEPLFVAGKRLTDAMVNRLRHAMLELRMHPGFSSILKPINRKLTGLREVQDKDYDSLREIIRDLRANGVDI